MIPPDDSAEIETEIAAQLLRLERAGERTSIELGPYSVFMLVAVLQLAARRFPAGDTQGDVFRIIGAPLETYFEGTAAGAFIAAEWTETDRVREARKQRKEEK
jgi:hypothetical protein